MLVNLTMVTLTIMQDAVVSDLFSVHTPPALLWCCWEGQGALHEGVFCIPTDRVIQTVHEVEIHRYSRRWENKCYNLSDSLQLRLELNHDLLTFLFVFFFCLFWNGQEKVLQVMRRKKTHISPTKSQRQNHQNLRYQKTVFSHWIVGNMILYHPHPTPYSHIHTS